MTQADCVQRHCCSIADSALRRTVAIADAAGWQYMPGRRCLPMLPYSGHIVIDILNDGIDDAGASKPHSVDRVALCVADDDQVHMDDGDEAAHVLADSSAGCLEITDYSITDQDSASDVTGVATKFDGTPTSAFVQERIDVDKAAGQNNTVRPPATIGVGTGSAHPHPISQPSQKRSTGHL